MNNTTRLAIRTTGSLLVAATLLAPAVSARQGGGSHGGGGGPRASAPSRAGGGPRASAPRSGGGARASAPRTGGTAYRHAPGGVGVAHAPRTANGTARYGYGGYHGYGYGYGHGGYYPYYPYWGAGWWYPWWGVGWYGCWDCYWPSYGYVGYDPSGGDDYVADTGGSKRHDPASVETKVSPTNAEVLVDGESVGFAGDYNGRWDRLRMSPGKHTIGFRAKGYRTLTVEIDARPGASYVLTDALVAGEGDDSRTVATAAPPVEPRPSHEDPVPMERPPTATGRLRVHAEPGDAAVYLDGEYLGLAAELGRIHGALAVPVGSHRLEAARPGYASATRTIEVGESDVTIAEISLEAQH